MRAGLQQQQQQQPPMHPNAPPGNLVSMHTLESGTGCALPCEAPSPVIQGVSCTSGTKYGANGASTAYQQNLNSTRVHSFFYVSLLPSCGTAYPLALSSPAACCHCTVSHCAISHPKGAIRLCFVAIRLSTLVLHFVQVRQTVANTAIVCSCSLSQHCVFRTPHRVSSSASSFRHRNCVTMILVLQADWCSGRRSWHSAIDDPKLCFGCECVTVSIRSSPCERSRPPGHTSARHRHVFTLFYHNMCSLL